MPNNRRTHETTSAMKLLILSLLLAVPGAQGAVIKWDAIQKTTNATVNANNATLTFHATNTSAQPIQFTGIKRESRASLAG